MSTNDVPGAKPENHDVLMMGCWAEHADGSLIFVEQVEAGTVVYSIFDVGVDPAVEYRDAMPEAGFKAMFSWDPAKKNQPQERWTWHDKTPFPFERVMRNFPAGQRHTSAVATMTAAQRIAESLQLRAEAIRTRPDWSETEQRGPRSVLKRLGDALNELRR